MTEREVRILTSRLMPQVKNVQFFDCSDFSLEKDFPLDLRVPVAIQDDAQKLAEKLSIQYWSAFPTVVQTTLKKSLGDEAYDVVVSEQKVVVSASTIQGIRHAFRTLRQLAEPERCVVHFKRHILPPCKIHDEPAMSFRGIHLCWFPETPIWEMEKQIRLAAYVKYNYVVIEPWGIFPYKCHPEFGYPEMKVKRRDFKRLIDLACELGITPVPQVNLLGHAAWSRAVSGKHATLGSHPELQSLFEPDGWSWCLANPHTRKFLVDMVDEIMDFFGNPPFFHAGCDEAFNLATCSACRKRDVTELIANHITFFDEHLRGQGARMLMWHDMLLNYDDRKFDGYIVFGNPRNGSGTALAERLPRDVIVCDWQYGDPNPKSKEPWPTSLALQKSGFDVLVSPWMNRWSSLSLIRFAAKRKLFGLLQTTWHRNRGIEMPRFYDFSASVAWNPKFDETLVSEHDYDYLLNRYLRNVDRDMGILSDYRRSGRSIWQIVPEGYPD